MTTTIVPREDITYLTQQSADKMNMILSGMTALLKDNDSKVSMLENQGWFQRMCKTVSGKNKMTKEEIRRNHDKINLYMTQAMTELFEQQCIDRQIIMSLGNQINELYADHLQLKQMLGSFVVKLNEKIESIDNFHILNTEIEQGVYSDGSPIAGICRILSQIDQHCIQDYRKMNILQRSMKKQGILNDEPVAVTKYLLQTAEIPMEEAGIIYMEMSNLRGNFIASLLLSTIESYHFLPDTARKLKNRTAIVEMIVVGEQLDPSVTLSTNDIYEDFINSKLDAMEGLLESTAEDDFARGEKAYDEQNYEEAVKWYRKAAEQGLAEAQNSLGDCYYNGDGVSEDEEEAVKWYRKAAEQGLAEAQNSLGDCYYNGDGVSKNYEEGVKWYRKAAEQGDAVAQFNLGYRYYCGKGVEEDKEEGVKWYRKAAEQGNAYAQYCLGLCYYCGVGVSKNDEEAVKWFRKAAEQGNAYAQDGLGDCYYFGFGVSENKEEAVKWFRKAAEQGYEYAKKRLNSLGYPY